MDSILARLPETNVVPKEPKQLRPSVDDVNLLRGDVNGLLESRTDLTRYINRIEETLQAVLANQLNQQAPEAVQEES